jgi:enoyl-CoA hydratase
MAYHNLLIDIEEGIATVKINRPKALNALNSETLAEIKDAVTELEARDDVNVLIITGEGDKAFVAGADIAEMRHMNPAEARVFSQLGHDTMAKIEHLRKPVIAAVNGFALGGGLELAVCCDFIYASEKAKMGLPEVTLAIFPGFAGTQRLPRLIGKGRAKELIFSGGMVDAVAAYEMGIVNKVVPHDSLMGEVTAVARKIAQNGPVAVSLAKEVINAGYDGPMAEAEAIEVNMWGLLFATEDQKEGMSAFMEKRKPAYKAK